MDLEEAKNVFDRFNNGEKNIECEVNSSLAKGFGVIVDVTKRCNKDSNYYDFLVKFDNAFLHETAHYVVELVKIKLSKCPKCKSINISRVESHGTQEVFTQQSNGKWSNNPFHDHVVDDPAPDVIAYVCDGCGEEFIKPHTD